MYGYASAYSPDLTAPGRALLPFEISTGRLIDDVWALWLEHDPVRMAPHHADALRSMRRIYLDAGKSDEYYLDLGRAGVRARSCRRSAPRTRSSCSTPSTAASTYRYPGAIRELVTALQA